MMMMMMMPLHAAVHTDAPHGLPHLEPVPDDAQDEPHVVVALGSARNLWRADAVYVVCVALKAGLATGCLQPA